MIMIMLQFNDNAYVERIINMLKIHVFHIYMFDYIFPERKIYF